jgi:Zn-dependent protease
MFCRTKGAPTLRQHFQTLALADVSFLQLSSSFDDEDNMSLTNSSISASEYMEMAARYKKKAKEIMDEAMALEAQQEAKKAIKTKQQDQANQEAIRRFFSSTKNVSSQSVSELLEKERWTVDQLIPIVHTLYEREKSAIAANNTEQLEVARSLLQTILEGAAITDGKRGLEKLGDKSSRWSGKGLSTLTAQLREWRRTDEDSFQRRLASDLYDAIKSNTTIEKYIKKSLGLATENEEEMDVTPMANNQTSITVLPYWIPMSLLPYIGAAKTLLDRKDVEDIKEKVLSASRFYCTSSESVPVAALFRGNIRSKGAVTEKSNSELVANVFDELQQLMKEKSISSRVQLFVMPDPEWVPDRDKQEPKPKPVILALPRAVVPDDALVGRSKIRRFVLNVVAVAAFASVCNFALRCYSLNWVFYSSIIQANDFADALSCYPIVAGIIAVQAAHEVAHLLVARRNGIRTGKPVPIPSPYLHAGLFGCITPLRSFPRNRSSLFDWALSGPLTGIIVSVLLMIFGLHHTVNASHAALTRFPVISIAELKCSFLVGSLTSLFAPKVMMLPNAQPIPMHPLFMVGFTGLLSSALNMLPVFRLDGGRACTAVLGTRTSALASSWTLLMLLSAALSGSSIFGYWAAIIIFFQRRQDIPVRDSVTKVNDMRVAAWIASLATSLLALLPFPGGPFPLL